MVTSYYPFFCEHRACDRFWNLEQLSLHRLCDACESHLYKLKCSGAAVIYETNASSRDSLLVCLNYLITCMWSKTSCLTSFVQPIARLDDDPFLWAAEERQRVDELRTVFTTSQRGLPSHLLERGQREKWFAETVLFDLSSDREHNRQILLTLVSILKNKTKHDLIG